MSNLCELIVYKYLNTIKNSFDAVEAGKECRIIAPYLRPDGEAIEIVVSFIVGDLIRLSDDYMTLDYLFINGMDLDSNPNLYKLSKNIAESNGVTLEESEIFIDSRKDDVGNNLDKLFSVINSITYLIHRRTYRKKKPFGDKVKKFLTEKEIFFKANYPIKGETVSHPVTIYINSTKNIAVSPFSFSSTSVAKSEAKGFAFMVNDIKIIDNKMRFVAVLDDSQPNKTKIIEDHIVKTILYRYSDEFVYWNEKNKLISYIRSLVSG